jgi:hypothetical protein
VRSGNLAAALAAAQESVSATLLTSRRASLATVVAQRALVRAHIGDVEASRLDCADAATLRERDGGAWAGTWIAAARGVLELSLGDPVAAWEACEPVTLAVEERGLGEPVLAFFLPDALEALIALGELDRAERLIDLFEARGRKLDRAWALATGARCRGLLLAARDDVDGAAAALERAIAEHERIEMPFERARTLLTQGIVQRRARRRGLAKSCFEESLASFERAGARLWADRARRELDRVGLWRSSAAQPEPEETPLRPV